MQTLWPALRTGQALYEVCWHGSFPIRSPSLMGETKPLTLSNLGQMGETKLLPLGASSLKEAGHQDENSIKTKLQIDEGK